MRMSLNVGAQWGWATRERWLDLGSHLLRHCWSAVGERCRGLDTARLKRSGVWVITCLQNTAACSYIPPAYGSLAGRRSVHTRTMVSLAHGCLLEFRIGRVGGGV
jgi:hypothetical protein